MNVNKAIDYVRQRGTPRERARIEWIVNEIKPDDDVHSPLLELQCSDGGFPFAGEKGKPSTVNSTLSTIVQLDELGLFASEHTERAVSYLLTVQKDDGGWDEDPAIAQYTLPPYITPGDLRTRLYLSSHASYWLALKNHLEDSKFREALYFLVSHQEETGRFFGFRHTTWIAASAFALAGRPYSKIVSRAVKYLMEKSFDEWADSQLAWAVAYLGRAGLPKAHPFISDCLNELSGRQQPDGTWISENGEAFTVDATICAVKAFKIFGALSG
jgi:squalene cyclase